MNHKSRILIVDDEEVVRLSFTRALATSRCEVKAVSCWSQIAQALQAEPCDVVLLDLRMPDVDGITVLRAVKQRWPQSEVIVITGYPTIETAKEAVALGAYDYLAKPVGPDQLIEASSAAMQHKRWALQEAGDIDDDVPALPCGAASPREPVSSSSSFRRAS